MSPEDMIYGRMLSPAWVTTAKSWSDCAEAIDRESRAMRDDVLKAVAMRRVVLGLEVGRGPHGIIVERTTEQDMQALQSQEVARG